MQNLENESKAASPWRLPLSPSPVVSAASSVPNGCSQKSTEISSYGKCLKLEDIAGNRKNKIIIGIRVDFHKTHRINKIHITHRKSGHRHAG